MDAERWLRAKDLFQAALEREPGQRDTFLRDACQDDESLRETVAAMLARHPDAVEFFRAPAFQAEAMALALDLENADGAPAERAPASVPEPATPRHRARRPTFPPWWVCLLALVFLGDVLLRAYCRNFGPEGLGFEMRRAGWALRGRSPGSRRSRRGRRAPAR